jgi:hypothetical protein
VNDAVVVYVAVVWGFIGGWIVGRLTAKRKGPFGRDNP